MTQRIMGLSPERYKEVLKLACSTFIEHEFYKNGFDVKQFIESIGIGLLPHSKISKESWEQITKVSKSDFCKYGNFIKDVENGQQLLLITYDDNLNCQQVFTIIMHEWSHYLFKHTQQCQIGECEAQCFAICMLLLMQIEQSFGLIKGFEATHGKDGVALQLQKFLSQEVDAHEKQVV